MMLFRPVAASFLAAGLLIAALPANAFETRARAAIVIDHNTGRVLLEKDAHTPLPPASMSKLMTLNMLFEALRDGRVTEDTRFLTSGEASRKGGSKMFLREGERVRVGDLIPGLIVLSGNDASIVVADGLAGDEATFARMMTERARALGMNDSVFTNASGWPDPRHRMSMADLAFIARRLIDEFPDYYPQFALETFTWAGIEQRNRNPLLGRVAGADGLKTGHTSEAGYGLVGSAVEGDRRIVFAITGLPDEASRLDETTRITNWALRQFAMRKLLDEGQQVGEAEVWMGAAQSVPLVVGDELVTLVPAIVQEGLTATLDFANPVQAPIQAGQVLGQLRIDIPELEAIEVPVLAGADVEAGGFSVRVQTAADVLRVRFLGGGGAGGAGTPPQ